MESSKEISVVFWNIGKILTKEKEGLISDTISSFSPDIFCIAEASSKEYINKLDNIFSKKKYTSYYTPLFSKRQELKPSYKYYRWGLKVFIKTDTIIKDKFTFAYQRQKGKIISITVFLNFNPITFIFLHNKSKNSGYINQVLFMKSLNEMIEVGEIADKGEKIIIMGDFNLEPWDKKLDHKDLIKTSYLYNKNSINQLSSKKCFYNPIVNYISNSRTKNLCGTHYGSMGWGLFDYTLYDTKDGDVDFEIISKLKSGKELHKTNNINKKFFNYGLDHLPIITKIKQDE